MPEHLVELLPPKSNHERRDGLFKQFNFNQSAPFFENPQGMLIHRVRSLYRLTYKDERTWFIVDYWCANGARPEEVDDGLLFDPGDKLVCARCEAVAVARGLKSSSELAGRHVCTGVCRPVNTCHPNDLN